MMGAELEKDVSSGMNDVLNLTENGAYEDAIAVIKQMQRSECDNYQLYYLLGISYEGNGCMEAAFYAYRFAAYLCAGTQAYASLIGAMDQAASQGMNGYKRGKALEQMIHERMKFGEYDRTYDFLEEQLYDQTTQESLKDVLTEENMLLFMMLEITLCEKNNMAAEQYAECNTIKAYQCSISRFKEVYTRVKFIGRRCWFGFEQAMIDEINEIVSDAPVSAHMLAVILKYSVKREYWIAVYQKVIKALEKKPEHADIAGILRAYITMFESIKDVEYVQEIPERTDYDDLEVIRLEYTQQADQQYESKDRLDCNKISVIFCTNSVLYANECVEYLRRLTIPQGMCIKVIEVWNAPGMAAEYNCAMKYSDAKYKLYIHHDTFIIKEDAFIKMIDAFKLNRDVGMMGIFGSIALPEGFLWWHVAKEDLRMKLHQEAVLDIISSYSSDETGRIEDCEGMDGIFLATSCDYPWREDIFDHWHFYDIAQCYEFRKHGKRTVFLNDSGFWVMHETTQKKDPNDLYGKYYKVFVAHYMQ